MRDTIPRVVIVGGGFGGLAAAKALKNAPAQGHLDRSHESSSVSASALPGRDVGLDARTHRFADPRRLLEDTRTQRSSSVKLRALTRKKSMYSSTSPTGRACRLLTIFWCLATGVNS